MKQQITTDQAPGAPQFLSQAIVSNGLIFVSGQGCVDAENKLTTEQKLAQIMKNISAILRAADATLNDIVKVTVYVTDMALMPELNKAYPSYFSEPYPAREAVCVKALPLEMDIEISVIAARS